MSSSQTTPELDQIRIQLERLRAERTSPAAQGRPPITDDAEEASLREWLDTEHLDADTLRERLQQTVTDYLGELDEDPEELPALDPVAHFCRRRDARPCEPLGGTHVRFDF